MASGGGSSTGTSARIRTLSRSLGGEIDEIAGDISVCLSIVTGLLTSLERCDFLECEVRFVFGFFAGGSSSSIPS